MNIFALILTLHIYYAVTTHKTAHMLKNIWGIQVSYQTVLNYVQTAAYYCHNFNQKYKGAIDNFLAGDETYLKVKKVWHYVWLFISTASHKIVAYHFSDNRGAKPAITTMLEALSTAKENQQITMVTDGNPSYQAGLHFINAQIKTLSLTLKKVIGRKNLDAESEEFRAFKQVIERLNRTYKYHVQSQNGFGSVNGAVSKLVLFVTHYNFLRPHKSLDYRVPTKSLNSRLSVPFRANGPRLFQWLHNSIFKEQYINLHSISSRVVKTIFFAVWDPVKTERSELCIVLTESQPENIFCTTWKR